MKLWVLCKSPVLAVIFDTMLEKEETRSHYYHSVFIDKGREDGGGSLPCYCQMEIEVQAPS